MRSKSMGAACQSPHLLLLPPSTEVGQARFRLREGWRKMRHVSSRTFPITSRPRFWCAGSPPSRGRRGANRSALMFQREVAERIVALPGAKQYGRLAVLAGWRTEARIIFDIAPSAFVPPPKVTSSVVRLVPRVAPLACTRATLERVTAAAFGQRRKMLRQSLRALDHDPQPILAAAGIDPTARAEDIAVEGFVALAKALDAMRIDATRHPKDCPKSLR